MSSSSLRRSNNQCVSLDLNEHASASRTAGRHTSQALRPWRVHLSQRARARVRSLHLARIKVCCCLVALGRLKKSNSLKKHQGQQTSSIPLILPNRTTSSVIFLAFPELRPMDSADQETCLYVVEKLHEHAWSNPRALDVYAATPVIHLNNSSFAVNQIVGWRARKDPRNQTAAGVFEYKVRWKRSISNKLGLVIFSKASTEGRHITRSIREAKINSDTVDICWKDQWLPENALDCPDLVKEFWNKFEEDRFVFVSHVELLFRSLGLTPRRGTQVLMSDGRTMWLGGKMWISEVLEEVVSLELRELSSD